MYTWVTRDEWESYCFDLDYALAVHGSYGTYEQAERDATKYSSDYLIIEEV